MKNLFERVAGALAAGETIAVATIARRLGSAPRDAGTRCAILADGTLWGTIGGGLLEARVQAAAAEAIADGAIRILEVRMKAKELADAGMICGGSVDVLIAPWGPVQEPVARAALAESRGPGRGWLITAWEEGGRAWTAGWRGSEGNVGRLPPGLDAPSGDGGQPLFRGDASAGVLEDPVGRECTPLVVLGAGHVGRSLAFAASHAGFAVTVVDDRPEFADREALPWAERVLCRPFDGALEAMGVDPGTFVVVCTRGHQGDAVCTEQAFRTPAVYVGVIGSRRKREAIVKMLAEAGISAERREALHLPVGLSIGAETPEEIAVSIVAEMIALRRGCGVGEKGR